MALRASWKVSGWSDTGLAFGTKPPGTASGTDRRDQRGVYRPCRSPEAAASVETSASCYHAEEDIRVLAIVKPILKLRKVQRQIFLAHIMVSADHAAFEQRPKRFHVVRVSEPAHVLTATMVDGLMRQVRPILESSPEYSPNRTRALGIIPDSPLQRVANQRLVFRRLPRAAENHRRCS